MRSDIQQDAVRVSVAHPQVRDALQERHPLVVRHGVGDADDFDRGGAECVAVLRRHDYVAVAHDAELERETHGRVVVFIAEVDDVPPGTLDDAVVGLCGVGCERWDGDLEFHVADDGVLDLFWVLVQVSLLCYYSENGGDAGNRYLHLA